MPRPADKVNILLIASRCVHRSAADATAPSKLPAGTVAEVHLTSRRTQPTLAAVAACLCLAAACGSTELEVEPTFDGNWIVSQLEVGGTTVELGSTIAIEIDTAEAAVRGRTECGEFFGSYTLIDAGADSGRASFTIPSPPPTESCPGADRADQIVVVEALESITTWTREAPALRLTQEPRQIELVLTPGD